MPFFIASKPLTLLVTFLTFALMPSLGCPFCLKSLYLLDKFVYFQQIIWLGSISSPVKNSLDQIC